MQYWIASLSFIASLVTFVPPLSSEEAKPYLFSLNGIYTHPISSKQPLVQQYFDQGMVFYYGYNFDEAVRAFQAAAIIDPQCAICYWGIAAASRGNIEWIHDKRIPQAVENAKRAEQLMSSATPQEQAYIQALVNSYTPNIQSLKDWDQAFATEMKKVYGMYPDDIDAAALYANANMNVSDDYEGVKKTFQELLKKAPKHPGLNHYHIHALDATSEPQEGLTSAKTLETLIPFAGHLLHMPAHIYYKTGQFHEATLATERAIKADEDLFAKGGHKGDYFSGLYLHNYQFLIASLMMEGKEKEALQVVQKLNDIIEKGKPTPSLYVKNALAVQKLIVLHRFGNWEQILEEPNPGTPVGNGMWHFTRSLAYLSQNDLAKAKSEASAIQEEQVDKSEDSLNVLLKVMHLHAQAAFEEKEGNQQKMIQDYQEAMELEKQIAYFEPPLWFVSAREALGFALLRAGKRTEAKRLFQEDLKMHPNKSWSLTGLKQSS